MRDVERVVLERRTRFLDRVDFSTVAIDPWA
jgi:hypothetical protein